MKNKGKDYHTEHCCVLHGCKQLDNEHCPVVNREKKQSFPCEMCAEDGLGIPDPNDKNFDLLRMTEVELRSEAVELRERIEFLEDRVEYLERVSKNLGYDPQCE